MSFVVGWAGTQHVVIDSVTHQWVAATGSYRQAAAIATARNSVADAIEQGYEPCEFDGDPAWCGVCHTRSFHAYWHEKRQMRVCADCAIPVGWC